MGWFGMGVSGAHPIPEVGGKEHPPWGTGGLWAPRAQGGQSEQVSREGGYHGHPGPGEAIPASAQPSLAGAAHQGDEVGESEGQRDVHTVLLAGHGPQLLVVAPLLEQVVDQPLLLIQAPAAWGGPDGAGLGRGPREERP